MGITELAHRLGGLLLGTAVGDSLGLPREGLSPGRARSLFGGPPLHHQFLFSRGMVSDDAEHACMTGQALLISQGDPERFARALAWRLRLWLLGAPAGIGFATLRSILKLWLGFPPDRSGVFSAGNGPAMRSPLLGLVARDPDHLRDLVRRSTRLTHTDPKAERGAYLAALAVRHGLERPLGDQFAASLFDRVRREVPDADAEFLQLLAAVESQLRTGASAQEFAESLGLKRGVTGYIYHTVFVALFCFLKWPTDYCRAVEEVILLGGDADTTAAVVGGLVGSMVGEQGIPSEWLTGLVEWPCSVAWMRELADRLAGLVLDPNTGGHALPCAWPAVLFRNVFFAGVVLTHGLRRLRPW